MAVLGYFGVDKHEQNACVRFSRVRRGGAEFVICVDNFVHDRCMADDDARLRQQRCMIYVEAPC